MYTYIIDYREKLWDYLFFDNCLNYLNYNSVSDEICSPESKFRGPHMSLLVMLKLIWNILSLRNLFKAYW